MSNPKHTPGPWSVNTDRWSVNLNGCLTATLDCAKGQDGAINREVWANAHLIAAAPDMFTLIQDISHWYESNGIPLSGDSIGLSEADVSVRDLLKQAIAKATGGDK